MAKANDENILTEVMEHYRAWTDDNEIRRTRKNGWDDITDAYYGKLPDDWPFSAQTVDPRIRTAIIEKNARLINSKLRGRLVPRETGDVLKARINNAVIEYQWDSANDGGSMLTKMGICDIDTRLYQSKFALIKWKNEYDSDDKLIFCGNEFYPLDIRDCGLDYAASHVRNAKWFQHKSWEFIEDLEKKCDTGGKPLFKNLGIIKGQMPKKQFKTKRKDNAYISRVKNIRGLTDRVGTDRSFPIVEIVTEYRKDKWITFAPDYKEIIREIKNPYDHGKIPVAQLRYYPLQDDALGESEVEGVIPLWKAIQATVCGFMDEVVLKIRPPLKVLEGFARIETIQYAPEAQWLMSRPDAVTEMQSSGEAIRYFETSYGALVSAFNTAMGMMSQGTSGVNPFEAEKTATEVRASMAQQNARDTKNQNDLAEFIKDFVMMWVSNNKQFLFQDPKKREFVMKIVGNNNFEYFKRSGLDQMILPPEAASTISDIIEQDPKMSDAQIAELVEAGQIPKHPVVENPNEKDPSKLKIKPKMKVNEVGDGATLYVTPEDLEGTFDYIPDVKSMAMGNDAELMRARSEAIEVAVNQPNMVQLLAQDGWRLKFKDLLEANYEDKGFRDAEKYFEKIQPDEGQIQAQSGLQGGIPQMGGPQQNPSVPRVPGVPQANPAGSPAKQMARPLAR